jgi:diacylglycerol kinase (ATP)
MGRLLLFANRYAGTLSRLGAMAPLEQYAREAGLEVEIIPTRNAGQLRQMLKERALGRVDRVVIAGGDGTIHTAVQVLAATDVALGILPQGTANNFASALRLPLDLPSAFRVIAAGEEQRVSLGEAEGEYFTEAAGVGLFADALALYGAGRRTKSIMRSLATMMRLWLTNKPQRLMLAVDGQRHVEEAVMVTVANTFRLGFGIPIAPTARVTDAHLDVVILGPLTRAEMLTYFRAIRAQSHLQLPKVELLTGREIVIRSRRPLHFHVDDQVRRGTPVTIRLVPDALKVLVDRL